MRAAEDGRTGPLPTLGEAIAAPFACPACGGFGMDHRCKESCEECAPTPQATDGMRTERVTLEITQFNNSGYKSPSEWDWDFFLRGEALTDGESVRVVEEVHFDDLAQVAMERDAAIREREELKQQVKKALANSDKMWSACLAVGGERDKLQARVAELEQQIGQADSEDAAVGYALRLFVDGRRVLSNELDSQQAGAFLIAAEHFAKYLRNEYKAPAEEAASGGGEQPRGWLTEEERGSIQHAATCAKSIWSYSLAQELENILARSSPPEVVLPLEEMVWNEEGRRVRKLDPIKVREALTSEGVLFKEAT